MAKARGTDAKLSRIKLLRDEPLSPALIDELRQLLHDKSNMVVGEAAEIVGERSMSQFTPDLAAAFLRFMNDPVATDPLCKAKIAIAETLNKLDYDQEELFLTALRHVQLEPRWGGSDDTAATLRGIGAFGLVRLGHRDILKLLVELLTDMEKEARIAAVRALGAVGGPAVVPLLHFKVRLGDAEAEVIGECFNSLLALEPQQSMALVAKYLSSLDEGLQEAAIFALGESRRPEALEILQTEWPRFRNSSLREVILLAIAMTRLPAGVDYLIELIKSESVANAMSVVLALAIHRHNPAVQDRVREVVEARNDAKLRQQFQLKFAN